MGTVVYLSPEQARGRETGVRTDVWSLGCVIYEMIAGKLPFAGETTADRIAAIINKEPAPLSIAIKNVPARLDEIVGKCLEKDCDRRYQTTKDLLIDLRRLQKSLEFGLEKERSNAPESVREQTENKSENKTQIIAATTDPAEMKTHTISSAEYVVSEIKRHKVLGLLLLALLFLVGIGSAVYKFYITPAKSQTTAANSFMSPQKLNFTRLSLPDTAFGTAISPDGRYAAYIARSGKRVSIRLRQIATNSDVEIVEPVENVALSELRFTPDGNHIYFADYRQNRGTIYKVPTLGGAPMKIAEQTISGAGVSPDGKTIAFLRLYEEGKMDLLQLADPDGSNERTLLHLSDPYSFPPYLTPAWSPDGKTVSCVIDSHSATEYHSKLSAVSVGDGSQRELSERDWATISGIVWLPDGNLIVCGSERSIVQVAPPQLWLIAPNAAPQRITNDLNSYFGMSVSATGETLVTTQFKNLSSLWVVPDNDATRAVQVQSISGIKAGVRWMSDDKLVFSSTVGGNLDIWTMNADGTTQRQLTAKQSSNSYPSMTADGRYIVFLSDRVNDGEKHIFRMDADGSNQKQLTFGPNEWSPRLSPDVKWVYYAEATPGDEPFNICKLPIEGGEPIVIGKNPMDFFAEIDISPRNGMVAYEERGNEEVKGQRQFVIISSDGTPIKTLSLPPTPRYGAFHWTPDGRAIAFVDWRSNTGADIWTIALNGKVEAKPLTNFKTESISDFAWSPDGKQLAVIRGTQVTDAVLISETR